MQLTPYRIVLDKPRLNILLYGPPGSGKTTLAASAQEHPALGPVLIANFEGGLLSITSRGDIDAVDIRSVKQMDDLFWALQKKQPPFDKYQTVVIDSGSEMQSLALEEGVARDLSKRIGGAERTIDDIQIGNYGAANAQISRLMRWFRDLPVNLIVTALPKVTMPQGQNITTSTPTDISPQFTTKLGVSVQGYMDFVWYLDWNRQNGRRYLITKDSGPIKAKTRGYNFGKAMGSPYSDPWLPTIYELLLSSESGNTQQAVEVKHETPVEVANIFPSESQPLADDEGGVTEPDTQQ